MSEEMAKQDCPNESRGKMERHGLGSIEAQEFIAENPASAVLPPDGSRIEQFRRDSAEYFQPRVDRALSRYDISVENTVISGIPCSEVTPNAGKVRGVVLHFFGGGFVCGSAYENLLIAAPICQYSGAKIVLPEYRLSPENLWPGAIEIVLRSTKDCKIVQVAFPLRSREILQVATWDWLFHCAHIMKMSLCQPPWHCCPPGVISQIEETALRQMMGAILH